MEMHQGFFFLVFFFLFLSQVNDESPCSGKGAIGAKRPGEKSPPK